MRDPITGQFVGIDPLDRLLKRSKAACAAVDAAMAAVDSGDIRGRMLLASSIRRLEYVQAALEQYITNEQ